MLLGHAKAVILVLHKRMLEAITLLILTIRADSSLRFRPSRGCLHGSLGYLHWQSDGHLPGYRDVILTQSASEFSSSMGC